MTYAETTARLAEQRAEALERYRLSQRELQSDREGRERDAQAVAQRERWVRRDALAAIGAELGLSLEEQAPPDGWVEYQPVRGDDGRLFTAVGGLPVLAVDSEVVTDAEWAESLCGSFGLDPSSLSRRRSDPTAEHLRLLLAWIVHRASFALEAWPQVVAAARHLEVQHG